MNDTKKNTVITVCFKKDALLVFLQSFATSQGVIRQPEHQLPSVLIDQQ